MNSDAVRFDFPSWCLHRDCCTFSVVVHVTSTHLVRNRHLTGKEGETLCISKNQLVELTPSSPRPCTGPLPRHTGDSISPVLVLLGGNINRTILRVPLYPRASTLQSKIGRGMHLAVHSFKATRLDELTFGVGEFVEVGHHVRARYQCYQVTIAAFFTPHMCLS